MLALDGGNLLGGVGEAGDLRSRLLLEALPRAGYDAVNVGAREAVRWADVPGLAAGAGIPWVSANAVLPASPGAPPAPPRARTFKFPGLRVAVIGLGDNDNDKDPGDFTPSLAALDREREALGGQADRLVVIGHLPLTRVAMIASTHPEIAAVLSGYGEFDTPRDPLVFGSTVAALTGTQGKAMVDLRLSLSGTAPRVQKYGLVPLDRSVPTDPYWDGRVAETLKSIRRIELARAKAAAPVTGSSAFVGSVACSGCHPAAADVWKASAHARAFASLERDGRDFEEQCVGCHVVGYKQAGGFVDAVRTPSLRDVQCESCHGPGRAHAETPQAGYGKIERPLCVGCHDPEHTDHFDYESAWKLIAH